MLSFFIKRFDEETGGCRIPVSSSDGFVPELMLRDGLSVLLLADSRDISHVSVYTRRLSPRLCFLSRISVHITFAYMSVVYHTTSYLSSCSYEVLRSMGIRTRSSLRVEGTM